MAGETTDSDEGGRLRLESAIGLAESVVGIAGMGNQIRWRRGKVVAVPRDRGYPREFEQPSSHRRLMPQASTNPAPKNKRM